MGYIKKDGARAWFVLCIVTFTVFLEVGIVKAFSVLLPDIKEQLETHTWIVGSSIGIMTGFGSTIGLLAGALVPLFGARRCMMMCGCIASIGLVICSLADTPLVLLIGLMLAGFINVQSIVMIGIVPDYFERYYSAAVGVYSAGAALAILTFPLVTELLMETFGWRGALLLLSGLFMNSIPCAALLRTYKRHETDTGIELETQPILKDNDKPCSEKTSVTQYLARKLGVQLVLKVAFVTRVFIPGLVLNYTMDGWMIYMVSFVISKGISIKTATIVVTIGGIGMLIIMVLVFLFYKFMTYKQIIYIATAVMAACFTLLTVARQLVFLNILSGVLGAAIGLFGVEVYISANINSEESESVHAFAWLNFAGGWTSILGGFVTGYFYDMTGSFAISFNIFAGVSLLATLSVGLGDIITRNDT